MRIAQLVTRRRRRGAEVFAAELGEALARGGHAVHYLGLHREGRKRAGAEGGLAPPGTEVADVAGPRRVGPLDPRLVARLARALGDREPDVVQANGGYAMKYAVLARRWGQGAWPIVYRNIGISSDWLRWPLQRRWNRWLMGQVEAIVSVAEGARDDLRRTYGVDPDRIAVVPQGVRVRREPDRAGARARLARAGVPEGARVLLHVGSFTPEKNHAGLLRIVERVRAEATGTRLVLVGDGPGRAAIEARAGTWVHLLGIRDDVRDLYAGAEALLLPSRTEGTPGVVLEAAAEGVPTVAYDVGGVAEVVDAGVTGLLVDAGDETGFAGAVVDLLGDGERRRALGDAARSRVAERHAFDRCVTRYEAVYEAARER